MRAILVVQIAALLAARYALGFPTRGALCNEGNFGGNQAAENAVQTTVPEPVLTSEKSMRLYEIADAPSIENLGLTSGLPTVPLAGFKLPVQDLQKLKLEIVGQASEAEITVLIDGVKVGTLQCAPNCTGRFLSMYKKKSRLVVRLAETRLEMGIGAGEEISFDSPSLLKVRPLDVPAVYIRDTDVSSNFNVKIEAAGEWCFSYWRRNEFSPYGSVKIGNQTLQLENSGGEWKQVRGPKGSVNGTLFISSSPDFTTGPTVSFTLLLTGSCYNDDTALQTAFDGCLTDQEENSPEEIQELEGATTTSSRTPTPSTTTTQTPTTTTSATSTPSAATARSTPSTPTAATRPSTRTTEKANQSEKPTTTESSAEHTPVSEGGERATASSAGFHKLTETLLEILDYVMGSTALIGMIAGGAAVGILVWACKIRCGPRDCWSRLVCCVRPQAQQVGAPPASAKQAHVSITMPPSPGQTVAAALPSAGAASQGQMTPPAKARGGRRGRKAPARPATPPDSDESAYKGLPMGSPASSYHSQPPSPAVVIKGAAVALSNPQGAIPKHFKKAPAVGRIALRSHTFSGV